MAVVSRLLSLFPLLTLPRSRLLPSIRVPFAKRSFHDYWVQKTPEGLSLRIPILKARRHLGAISSRGDRAENQDRFKVGLMNELTTSDGREPFYFAIIDGYHSMM
jgi:hypothetical protein